LPSVPLINSINKPRRRDLLELLDRLDPTIAYLTQAIEQEVEKCPAAQRLRTHPGVGSLTALAFVLIIGRADRFQSEERAKRQGKKKPGTFDFLGLL
jgi:transposase